MSVDPIATLLPPLEIVQLPDGGWAVVSDDMERPLTEEQARQILIYFKTGQHLADAAGLAKKEAGAPAMARSKAKKKKSG